MTCHLLTHLLLAPLPQKPVQLTQRQRLLNEQPGSFGACAPSGYLFFPGQTAFFAGNAVILYLDVNYRPHANGSGVDSWPANTQFERLVGQTRELFYRSKNQTRYAGTYKVATKVKLTQDDCKAIEDGTNVCIWKRRLKAQF